MKTLLINVIIFFFTLSVYSQNVFIYGDDGKKIYFQETDSIVQLKFKKDAENNEKLDIAQKVNPDLSIVSFSKNDRIDITLGKEKSFDYKNLKSNRNLVYVNRSLLSDDGTIQIPTDKVLVKIKNGYELEESLSKLGIVYENYKHLGHNKNSYIIILKDGESLNIANSLYESGLFEYAQPSFTRFINMTNEFYPNQWGLNNTGQSGGTSGIDINAPEAWQLTQGSNNITVAVIDQGVDLDHPDLTENLLTGYDATDGGNGGTNGDCWGNDAHGTCCAGVIAARNNTIGTIGVAPNCRIVPIRVSYTSNGNQIWDDDWVVDAINHAWEVSEVDVLSCSWYYTNVSAITNEISDALSLGRNNLGCIVVFAAGNLNSSVSYPANSNPDILAVGAMSPCGERKRSSSSVWDVNPGVSPDPNGVSCDGEKWWGSNYGSQLDIVAPGVKIYTTDIQSSAGYNTSNGTNGNYYASFNGTSSACPHVAGVAALMLSVNPTLTGQQVRDVIEQTAQKAGNYSYTTTTGRSNGTWNNEMGYGLVNAYAAVYAVAPRISGPSTVCDQATYTIDNLPQGATVQWSAINFIPASGTGTSFTAIAKNGAGQDRIRATITLPSGNTIPLSLNVDLNGYAPIDGPDEGYISQKRAYFTMPEDIVISQWMVNGIVMHPDTPNRLILSPLSQYYPGNVLISCTGISDCGTFTATKDFQVIDDTGGLYLIYPNPASTSFRIKQKIPENEVVSDKTDNSDLSVLIYNNQSLLLGRYSVKENEPIDIHLLRDGFYIVHIIKDSKIYEAKLIIKRN